LNKAGRAAEISYQMLKTAKEQKLDIEKALFDNNARVAGDSTTARELASLLTRTLVAAAQMAMALDRMHVQTALRLLSLKLVLTA